MSQLVQTPPTALPRTQSSPAPRLQLAVLAALLLWLYARVLIHLLGQWWHDPNFSHGFFVPLFSAYVLWQERERLTHLAIRRSRSGVLIVTFALCILIVGQLGAELFLARVSFLLMLAGLLVLFFGWPFFRATLFPWAFLFLMIPIPIVLFNQITFPLQLLASRLSASVLDLLGVPVALNGNIIQLAAMPLNVAEACSGIRSLMSLLTLAIIYGYLAERRLWLRWVLALASLPIAIAANSVRIIGTGLLVQRGYADEAEGYFHASWGLIIFGISLLMLYALHALVRAIWPETVSLADRVQNLHRPARNQSSRAAIATSTFIVAVLLIATVAVFLQFRARAEIFPPRPPLHTFPQQLDPWSGSDIPIDPDTLEVLGPGEFLHRAYEHGSEQNETEPSGATQPAPDNSASAQPAIDLFLAYFPSQRAGETPHSPQHCLPGSGWASVENQRITLVLPGETPFPANRYIIAKGDSRELVLYWFWAHGRGVASEYWNKYYLVKDAIQLNRTDGALVRMVTPMSPYETPAAALQRLLPFAAQVAPLLDRYIPR
jgi:EpsI family protein